MGLYGKPKANIFKSKGVTEETELWKPKFDNHLHHLGKDLINQKFAVASLISSVILKYTIHLLPNVLLLVVYMFLIYWVY